MKVVPKDATYYLAKHLHHYEFMCRCKYEHCIVTLVNPRVLHSFSTLRTIIDRPLVLTSGFRCPQFNKFVGGVERSSHMTGSAMDFLYPSDYDKSKFIEDCKACFDVVLPFKDYVHCDDRG